MFILQAHIRIMGGSKTRQGMGWAATFRELDIGNWSMVWHGVYCLKKRWFKKGNIPKMSPKFFNIKFLPPFLKLTHFFKFHSLSYMARILKKTLAECKWLAFIVGQNFSSLILILVCTFRFFSELKLSQFIPYSVHIHNSSLHTEVN